ncbi:MAG: potassium-transporting ATPase subunit KdpC [Bdellovibrio sp.]
MKHMIQSLRMLIFMTLVTGVAYPLLVTGISQMIFPHQANGSMFKSGEVLLGSSLVAQNFEGPKYFWPRPSAVSFNPLPSGGSNLSLISADLKKTVDERKAKLQAAHPGQGEPPQDLLFASGSGLDPEITPEAAQYQILRIAKARGIADTEVSHLVEKFTEGRQMGIFGEPRVHVLALNAALDEYQGIKISPNSAPVAEPTATSTTSDAGAGNTSTTPN